MHNEIPRTLPETIGDYAAAGAARFHMPGHKGQGMMGPLGMALAPWDVTELPGTDDLHAPEGAILAAERAYAEAYGARHSFLLVGGSTAGILAMLLALGKTSACCLRGIATNPLLRAWRSPGMHVILFIPKPRWAGRFAAL